MVAFSGGTAADTCREWPPAARIENYLAELEKVYKRHPSELRAVRASWTGRRDPWVKASYSFPAPGQVTTQGPTLRQGIGRLHFAGEYTSYAFMGYMEGALNSGAAVARRIAVKDGVVKGSSGVSRQNLAAGARAGRASWSWSRPAIASRGAAGRGSRRGRSARRSEVDAELTPGATTVEREGRAGGGDRHRRLGQHGRGASPDRTAARSRRSTIARRAALDLVEQFAQLRARAPGRAGAARPLRVQPPPRRTRLPRDRPDGPARSRARRGGHRQAATPTAARRSARR